MKVSTADKKVIDVFLSKKELDSRALVSNGSTLIAKFGKEGILVASWEKDSLVIHDKNKGIKEIVDALKLKLKV